MSQHIQVKEKKQKLCCMQGQNGKVRKPKQNRISCKE